MARKNSANFFLLHYDKVVLAALVCVLAGSVFSLVQTKDSAEAEKSAYQKRLSKLKAKNEKLAPVSAEAFSDAIDAYENAFVLTTNRTLLVAAPRIYCINLDCLYPILQEQEICPKCHTEQPKESDAGDDWDSDNDGMPDLWEKKYGLNPLDPMDADGDLDNDGFTNLEEYVAKTLPNDPKSHPPRYDFLRVAALTVSRYPVEFHGTSMLKGDGIRAFAVKDSSKRDWYLKPGDQLSDSGFILKSAEPYTAEKKTSTGTRKMQFYRLTFTRGEDFFVITSEPGVAQQSSVFEVSFVCTKDKNGETYKVKRGESFTFDNDTFKLIRVNPEEKTAIVVQGSTGKEISVPQE